MFRTIGVILDSVSVAIESASRVVAGTGRVLEECVDITGDEVEEAGVDQRIGHVQNRRVRIKELGGMKLTKDELSHIYRRGKSHHPQLLA
mgnify:CR=1 FL=1